MESTNLFLIAAILIMIGYVYFSIYRKAYNIKFIHHTGLAILMGMGLGALLKYSFDSTVQFKSAIFFDFMLPLMIFEQGYNMKRKRFFKNIGTIALFGVLGTIICFILVGLGNKLISDWGWIVDWNGNIIYLRVDEALILAAILCSSDTLEVLTLVSEDKTPKLHSILFGEGALNAAISILLFDTFRNTDLQTVSFENIAVFTGMFFGNFLGSACLGVFFGLLTSWIMKKSETLTEDASAQTAVMLYISYLSYLCAGVSFLSTILTLLICAITNGHYTWYNLSPEAQHVSSNTFKVMGNTAEAITFAYIGLSTWSIEAHKFSWSFLMIELGLMLLVRALAIIFCSGCVMIVKRKKEFSIGHLAVLWLGGSIKGAIVYGLINVVSGPHEGLMIITTVGLVFLTTVGIEFILPCFVSICDPKENVVNLKDVGVLFKADGGTPMTNLLLTHPNQQYHLNSDDLVSRKSWLHGFWRRFDDKYLKPFLIRQNVLDEIKEVKREIVKDAILSIGPRFSMLCSSQPVEPLLEVN